MSKSKTTSGIQKGRNGFFSLTVTTQDGKTTVYRDLTKQPEGLRQLSDAINAGDVAEIHLEDLLEDLLD